MRKYQKFEEVPVWQEGAKLYQRVLDLIEEPNVPFSAAFRTQLERASLCVSSSVAEGFEGVSTPDLLGLLVAARGAAMEVQSMVTLIKDRPKAARLGEPLMEIRACAESCARQLGAWRYAIENPGQAKRAPNEPEQPSRPKETNPGRQQTGGARFGAGRAPS